LGPEYKFQSKFAKYLNRHNSKSTNSINTKFEEQIYLHKTLWVVQNYKMIVQDGGGRHFVFSHKTYLQIKRRGVIRNLSWGAMKFRQGANF